MRRALALASLLLAALTTGCWSSPEPARNNTSETPVTESTQVDLASLRYDTGDVAQWPDYHLPLQYTFDIPEVPPEIVGPFSPDDIPDTSGED